MQIPLDFAWIEATGLAAARTTAFVFVAPPFSYGAFPARIKAMVALGVALALSGTVAPGYVSLGTGDFFLALTMQVVAGAALGFLVLACFAAVQSAGGLIDVFGGFQLAQAFDPQMNVNGAQFTRLFQMIALALLFASNGYQLILAGLARSFTAIPVDGVLDLARPVDLLVDTASQLLVAALQIAGPLLLVLVLADIALGLVSRVAPALNAFALGFPLKIILTFLLAGSVILALPAVVAALTDQAARLLIGSAG
ncbi:MAG: flagellar biosynthetic protein FliR [Microbacterium arborescens]